MLFKCILLGCGLLVVLKRLARVVLWVVLSVACRFVDILYSFSTHTHTHTQSTNVIL